MKSNGFLAPISPKWVLQTKRIAFVPRLERSLTWLANSFAKTVILTVLLASVSTKIEFIATSKDSETVRIVKAESVPAPSSADRSTVLPKKKRSNCPLSRRTCSTARTLVTCTTCSKSTVSGTRILLFGPLFATTKFRTANRQNSQSSTATSTLNKRIWTALRDCSILLFF